MFSEFISTGISANKKKLQSYSTLLSSISIEHDVRNTIEGPTLFVRSEDLNTVREEINAYEISNLSRKSTYNPTYTLININRFIFSIPFILLLLFHILRENMQSLSLIKKSGMASADHILSGELYRTVTALTLHANVGHVLSNIVFGAIVSYALFRLIGSRTGWFLIIISGAFGNYLNALFYQTHHNAIGASTAVFAGVGLLSAIQLYAKYRPHKKWFRWVPIAAGLGLLGMLGAGKNSDIMAHLFGFISGLGFGIVSGFLMRNKLPSKVTSFILVFLTVFIIGFSWYLAL